MPRRKTMKSNIYTKTGDAGTTSLVGGTRASKASIRLEAYGTADELNSHIGLLLALDGVPDDTRSILEKVQHRLFNLGSELATEPDSKWRPQGIIDADVEMLEAAIDEVDATLPRHNRFILPGGTLASAQANVARTVARRCERHMVGMVGNGESVGPAAMRFINRLSDYLFVIGRQLNILSSKEEIFWNKDCK